MYNYMYIFLILTTFGNNTLFAMYYDKEVQIIMYKALQETLKLARNIQQPNGAVSILTILHRELQEAYNDNMDINDFLNMGKNVPVKNYLVDMRTTIIKDPNFKESLKVAYATDLPDNWIQVKKSVCQLAGYWAQFNITRFIKQKDDKEAPKIWFEKNRFLDPEKDAEKLKAAFFGQFMALQIVTNAKKPDGICHLFVNDVC